MLRASSRVLADASSTITAVPGPIKQVATQLLPPLQLYRRLLRVHRNLLPPEMRIMGDEYVKAEFRRTKTIDNPLQVVGFLSEWKTYLDHHEQALAESLQGGETDEERIRRVGKRLDDGILEQMSADQIGQLYELLQATKDVYLTPEEIAEREQAQGREPAPAQPGIPRGQELPDLGATRGTGEGQGR